MNIKTFNINTVNTQCGYKKISKTPIAYNFKKTADTITLSKKQVKFSGKTEKAQELCEALDKGDFTLANHLMSSQEWKQEDWEKNTHRYGTPMAMLLRPQYHGHLELEPEKVFNLLKLMLQKGANPNQRINASTSTPLVALMDQFQSGGCMRLMGFDYSERFIPKIKLLLDHGADPDMRFQDGNTIFDAERLERYPAFKRLLKESSYQYADPIKSTAKGFSGISGMSKVKEELRVNFIKPLLKSKHPELYKKTNVKSKPAQGLLLYGGPGTGKSFIAGKLADELKMNPIFAKASDLEGEYLGHTQKKIEELFNRAADQKPCLLIIDEFDQIARKIAKGTGDDSSWNDTKRAAILVELQNAAGRGITVVGTTNKHPRDLDPATVREQRIDVHVEVPLPDKEARAALFKTYIYENMEGGKFPFTREQVNTLANDTKGFSAASIQTICETAARKMDDADSDWDIKYLDREIASKNEASSITNPKYQPKRYLGFLWF